MRFCIFMSYCCTGRMTIMFPLSVFAIIASLFLSFVFIDCNVRISEYV